MSEKMTVTVNAFSDIVRSGQSAPSGDSPMVPHMDQYNGLWAIESRAFQAAINHVNSLDLLAHIKTFAAQSPSERDAQIEVVGSVAVVEIVGSLTKFGSSLGQRSGTVALRRAIRTAADDPRISSILLKIDSPGGTVAGTGDLADDVREAATKKTVIAHIEDMGASAAFWIASQATRIVANESASVGSIGTFGVIFDQSKAFEKRGIVAHVIRSGEHKGVGVPGAEVTDNQLAELQRHVNAINAIFVAAVQQGRGLTEQAAESLADGRVHVAGEALALGLIDDIGNFESALEQAADMRTGAVRLTAEVTQLEEKSTMSDAKTQEAPAVAATVEPLPATIGELKQAFPDSDAEFREECLVAGNTLPQAQNQWMERMRADNATQAKELEKLRADAKKTAATATTKPGVSALSNAGGVTTATSGDAMTEWPAAVQANVAAGMNRPNAIMKANRDNPGLRVAYVDAYNAANPGRPV